MSVESSNKTHYTKKMSRVQRSEKRVKPAVEPQTVEHDEDLGGTKVRDKSGILSAVLPGTRTSLPLAKQAAINADRQGRVKDTDGLRASSAHLSNEPQHLRRSVSQRFADLAKRETFRTSSNDRMSCGATSEETVPNKSMEESFPHDASLSEPHDRASSANPQVVLRDLLLRAGYDFPKLMSRAEEPVEESVTRVLHEYRELSRSLDAAYRSLDQSRNDPVLIEGLKTELHTLRNELRASNMEADERRKEARNSHHQMVKAQGMLGERNVRFEEEKREWERETEKLRYQHDSQLSNETQRMHGEEERLKTWYEEQSRTIRHEEEKRHEQEISGLKKQLTEEHWKWDAHMREVKITHETRLRKLEATFDEQMKDEYERHRGQMHQEKEVHERKLKEYQSNIAKIKLESDHEKRQLLEELQSEQERLREEQKRCEKELERQEAQLNLKHTHDLSQLRIAYEEQGQEILRLKHVEARSGEERLRMRSEVQTRITQFSEERQQLTEWSKKREAELTENHALEISKLRLANEELKQAFVQKAYPQRTKARSAKVMRYRDVSTQFYSVVGQVQDFANLGWDMRREKEWPFSNDQLLQIHQVNTRVLKKAILQNTIWILLYSHVFCTPFAMLGLEGESRDSVWIPIYTQSIAQWPSIPAATEARRCETSRIILELMDSTSELPPDEQSLKASYEATVISILNTIHQVLSRVATLELKDVEALEKLVRLAAKTWMELCSQPYRVMMILPPGSGDLLSSPNPDERPLKLIVSPELKRYGNMQGEDLMKGEVFTRCQAVVQQYPVEPTGS